MLLIKIKDIYRYLKRLRKERLLGKEILRSKSEFLVSGYYKTVVLGKVYFYKDFSCISFLKKQAGDISGVGASIKFWIKILIGTMFAIKIANCGDATEKHVGALVLLTKLGDIKIFDLQQQRVLNLWRNIDDYNRFKETHEIFSPFFDIPLERFDDQNLLSVEKYIDFKPVYLWDFQDKENTLKFYYARLLKYLEDCIQKEKIVIVSSLELWRSFPDTVRNAAEVRGLKCMLVRSQIKHWPFIQSHGDFCSINVLITNDKRYLIDWTERGQNMFFYDLLHFMIRSAVREKDYSLLDNFLQGFYDEQMTKLFALANLEFCSQERPLYVGLCIVRRIYNFNIAHESEDFYRWLNLIEYVFQCEPGCYENEWNENRNHQCV